MSAYAIVETGSKQYRVEPKSVIEVELLDLVENQKEVTLDRVLLYHDGKTAKIGKPTLAGAKVVCELLGEIRGPKTISLKYRRRKNSKASKGHRQDLLRLQVKEIQA